MLSHCSSKKEGTKQDTSLQHESLEPFLEIKTVLRLFFSGKNHLFHSYKMYTIS